jgi:hypothetical protein
MELDKVQFSFIEPDKVQFSFMEPDKVQFSTVIYGTRYGSIKLNCTLSGSIYNCTKLYFI